MFMTEQTRKEKKYIPLPFTPENNFGFSELEEFSEFRIKDRIESHFFRIPFYPPSFQVSFNVSFTDPNTPDVPFDFDETYTFDYNYPPPLPSLTYPFYPLPDPTEFHDKELVWIAPYKCSIIKVIVYGRNNTAFSLGYERLLGSKLIVDTSNVGPIPREFPVKTNTLHPKDVVFASGEPGTACVFVVKYS